MTVMNGAAKEITRNEVRESEQLDSAGAWLAPDIHMEF